MTCSSVLNISPDIQSGRKASGWNPDHDDLPWPCQITEWRKEHVIFDVLFFSFLLLSFHWERESLHSACGENFLYWAWPRKVDSLQVALFRCISSYPLAWLQHKRLGDSPCESVLSEQRFVSLFTSSPPAGPSVCSRGLAGLGLMV